MKRKTEITTTTTARAPSALEPSPFNLFADTMDDAPDTVDSSARDETPAVLEFGADRDDVFASGVQSEAWGIDSDTTADLTAPASPPGDAREVPSVKGARRSSSGMRLYGRAMAAHPLLDAAGERRLAATIEKRGDDVWAALLRDEALAQVAIDLAEARLEGAGQALEGVRHAIRAAAAQRGASSRSALARAAAEAAPLVRALDVDHLVADELVRKLERAAADPSSAPASLRVPRVRRRLARQVEQVTRAARAAADARNELVQHNLRYCQSQNRKGQSN